MNRVFVLASLILLTGSSLAWARTPADPCRVKSRQMTLAKNCYSGDMARDGAPKFYASTTGNSPGVSYCYNSLIEIEHKPGQAVMKIHVLRDTKDGTFHAYDYTLAPDDLKKTKKDATFVSLKGLKGECFSATGDKEVCSGGFLKTIGLKDTSVPMVVAVGKSGSTQYSVNHIAHDPKELDSHKPKEVDGVIIQDTAAITAHMVSDIHRHLSSLANVKLAQARSGRTTPKRLSDTSEQFRYCSMALESFLRTQKLTDPFTPQEKQALNNITNYMNNDPAFATVSRMPAGSTPVVTGKHK